jgi:hypothetical protein
MISGAGLLLAGSLAAQEVSKFTFQLDAGFTQPVGNTGRNLDTGWNIGTGAGMNLNSFVGAMIDVNYNSLGISSTTLTNIGVPGGNVNVFSATFDPIVHLTPHSHFDLYVSGGGGLYHRYEDFSAPGSGNAFNPFFGGNQILASSSVNKPGVDGGAGIAFGSKWHGKFFAEARYNRIFMSNGFHTDYVPVSFGFRW